MNIGKVLATGLTMAGALMALPSASPAQSLDLYLGPGGPDVQMRDRDYDRDNYRSYRGCSERQAIRRAYSLGLDDPEIESVTRRQVVVDGVGRRGRYTTVYFANRPGCPRIG
ncbi:MULTISPECIES: hypothetical protein [unclassified Sinorhizobium]|uniref:hypothetical protein n=1 Tax=unclassified Sinorhizobium TaxID=2613772 RepID=UPI0024C40400|nr:MULTISPECIES: hypothetical protein [unclassified Sinorhizobium]MDK1372872.1 hypothetical protein [Sinorhizobium sp. 6-70]MDK1477142.1 hypothetical protein [Sinorhizobium sp. 6-117]MDK1477189.1 hypothetical protein [Sinorhizobium sp. 6-117]